MNYSKYETKCSNKLKVKNHIFEVAINLMNEIGYENLTIKKIREVAGISTGKFYQHFESKEDLIAFYCEKAQEVMDDIVKETLLGKNFEEQLISFYTLNCALIANLGQDFCRNFYMIKNKNANTILFSEKFNNIINSLFEDAIKNGFVISNERTTYEVTNDMCIIVGGALFNWSFSDNSYDISEFVEGLLRRCLKGIL